MDEVRRQFFPFTLANGITLECCDDLAIFWEHAGPLLEAIFPSFPSIRAYGYAIPPERRDKAVVLTRQFARAHHEHFLFRTGDGRAVGFSYGDMRDAQTCFMTSSGVLSAYRRQGMYSAFVMQLLRYLHALGYERVVSRHQPNNRAVIIAKLRLGFNITAVNLDQRWGAQVELTYLFHDDRRSAYCRAFALEDRPTPQPHLA